MRGQVNIKHRSALGLTLVLFLSGCITPGVRLTPAENAAVRLAATTEAVSQFTDEAILLHVNGVLSDDTARTIRDRLLQYTELNLLAIQAARVMHVTSDAGDFPQMVDGLQDLIIGIFLDVPDEATTAKSILLLIDSSLETARLIGEAF